MKIAILTQPLHSNYGGVLQNYALQQILIQLGHQPITIDQKKNVSYFKYILSVFKTLLLYICGIKRRYVPYKSLIRRNEGFQKFVDNNIITTLPVGKLKKSIIRRYNIDGIIVGSDQVWRPKYNKGNLNDMYLSFTKGMCLKRLAYAASFGVDNWEYAIKQTNVCANLALYFDAISVREDSAILLCEKYLGVVAKQVLDPTLLLNSADYCQLCKNIELYNEPYIFAYILDLTEEKRKIIEELKLIKKIPVRIYGADINANLSPEQWISMFRDASYVITDSFHGTCFSIIFEREFFSIGNNQRGTSRFLSLLSSFSLEDRYISLPLLHDQLPIGNTINWKYVNTKLVSQREIALKFLADNLN